MKSYDFEKIRNYVLKDIEAKLYESKQKDLNKISLEDEKIYEEYNFENSYFEEIDFNSNIFIKCSFKGSIFINCNFNNTTFDQCDLEYTILKNSNLEDVNLNNSKLRGGAFLDTYIKYICISDCDCRNFKLIRSLVLEFEFDDTLNTKFDEDTFIDKVSKYNKEYKRNRYNYYEISYKFYRDISYKYKQNNLQSLYGEYYYLSKVMERKTLKGIDKFKSTILWIICGYGERPTYALISSIEIIFVFTILYMIFGLNCGSQLISYKEIFLEGRGINFVFNDFIKAFHFSIVTFTTVGYGDVTPIGYSVFLSGLEMFLGVTMVGLWTATLAKKISR